MNNDKLWILKLIAWFHDPPDKMLELPGHEWRALKSLEQLIGQDEFQNIFNTDASQLETRNQREAALKDIEEWNWAKKADQIASAMDRSAAFPGALKVDWSKSSRLRHTLSGRELDLGVLDQTGIADAIEKVIDEVKAKATDAKSRYFLLWRLMQRLLSERNESSLKANWYLLPADSRIVDHSIWDHLGATSAVAGALPEPALLVFGIGPVQDFIATARRTQDLWMGSYILSYLSWQGMKVIADQFGPDVMLYPSLRGQPLVDHWLKNEMKLPVEQPSDESLTRATLPNKFVALLPNDKAEGVAKAVVQAIRVAWEELAAKVSQWLWDDLLRMPMDADWRKMWDEQTSQIPECYWSVYRWPGASPRKEPKDDAVEVLNEYKRLLTPRPDDPFDSIFAVFVKTAPDLVNVGTTYSRLHELAQHGFEARKTMRDFKPAAEEGAKCTMCGQRAALRTAKLSAREFWKDVSKRLRARKDLGLYVAIKPDGNERLCGVCTAKRFVQRAYFERKDVLDLRGGFPSTSSVAAARFKAQMFEKLLDPKLEEGKRKDLIAAMQAHLNALERLDFHLIGETGERMLPRLSTLRDGLPENLQEMATDFIHYDGDAFYEETFTADRLEKDYGLDDVDEGLVNSARGSLRRLITVCRELRIAPPAKYLAILKFDGDRIRDWLSGQKAPIFADVLHPEVRKMLEDRNWEEQGRNQQVRRQWEELAAKRTREGHPITADDLHSDWQKLLRGTRFLSPALHASLSHALANFALNLAPFVVEQRYCGRIVYAGGDDLLALLPLDQVLPVSRELRAFYSGQAEKNPFGGVDVRLTNTDLAGFVEFDGEKLMTMGTTATASIGVCLAHHLSLFDKALEVARTAEKSAKAKDRYGRDALCVNFLRRSGEEMRVGARWNYEALPIDTFDLLAGLQRDFTEDRLSMKFAHAVYDQARVLAGSTRQPETEIPAAAREAALRRLLIRQRGAEISSSEAEDQAKILAPQLARLAGELQSHCESDDPAADEVQPGMVQLAQWLQITRFLAQGGDD